MRILAWILAADVHAMLVLASQYDTAIEIEPRPTSTVRPASPVITTTSDDPRRKADTEEIYQLLTFHSDPAWRTARWCNDSYPWFFTRDVIGVGGNYEGVDPELLHDLQSHCSPVLSYFDPEMHRDLPLTEERVWFSGIGFSADRTRALVYVTSVSG